jgi:heme/copper-type cytochrome/quinol oxidase subunit 2
MSEISPNAASSNELVRQGERTVDNLKRLFAVIFALSFGIVGNGIFAKLKTTMLPPTTSPPTWLWLLNIEMATVFLVTAAVFYHQSVKFLDIRYARQPLSAAHPWGFAADYLQLVLTAAPFFLMANSLGGDVTHKVGYLWFFVSYVSLLAFGLVLLVVSEVRHSKSVREKLLKEQIAPEEIKREGLLRAYWMVMNGAVLLVLLVAFWWTSRGGGCPALPAAGALPWFLYFFGFVALGRDYLDFRWAWPFLYPVSPANAAARMKWPMTRMVASTSHSRWIAAGMALAAADTAMICAIQFWDFRYWTAVCH